MTSLLSNLNILISVLQFCVWFFIGIYLWIHIFNVKGVSQYIENKLNVNIKDITFIELWLISFTVFLIIKLFILVTFNWYIMDYYHNFSESIDLFNYLGEDGNKTSAQTNQSNSISSGQDNRSIISTYAGRATDSIIGATGLTGGFKLAQSQLNLVGKAACVCGGIASACLCIIGKNISGNISENAFKKNLISSEELANLIGLQLSGNDFLDLLSVIQFYQKLSFIFLGLICYYLIILSISDSYVETKLKKYLNPKLSYYILRLISVTKKSSSILLICLFILLFICLFFSSYYTDFIISNFDKISDYYITKK
jgi:hypothetical protein